MAEAVQEEQNGQDPQDERDPGFVEKSRNGGCGKEKKGRQGKTCQN